MRQLLRELFSQTLAEVSPRQAFARHGEELRRRVGAHNLVIAFGKAARSMAEALLQNCPDASFRGLVVPPEPDDAPLPPLEVIAGGHPLPTAGSLRAAARALELARGVQPHERLLFLVSGGGSAMLELPAVDGVSLDELRALYRALVGSGASIDEINTVRGQLSATKGGRLALAGRAATSQQTLAVSDVPEQSLALASNPTGLEDSTPDDCRAVLDRFELWRAVPPALRAALEESRLPPVFAADDELGRRAEHWRILDERHARRAATRAAERRGFVVDAEVDVDDWPVERAADELLHRLDRMAEYYRGSRVAIVTTGELSVPLPEAPGTGGRNQQFALAMATRIRHRAVAVLSCGTDGIDGSSTAAGAVVDGTTVARAAALGLDVADHLQRCDAHPLLDALGDTVVTGPTGTNVRDLRILVHEA